MGFFFRKKKRYNALSAHRPKINLFRLCQLSLTFLNIVKSRLIWHYLHLKHLYSCDKLNISQLILMSFYVKVPNYWGMVVIGFGGYDLNCLLLGTKRDIKKHNCRTSSKQDLMDWLIILILKCMNLCHMTSINQSKKGHKQAFSLFQNNRI